MPDGSLVLRVVRREARERLQLAGLNPRDGDELLGNLLGLSFSQMLARDETQLDAGSIAEFDAALTRRIDDAPLQYIIGHTGFYGRSFAVDERVLIPRPETELLVQKALSMLDSDTTVLDVGTGSGCIAITMALEKRLHVFATDLSIDALLLAGHNARCLDARVAFVAARSLDGIGGMFDMIISNPPYIGASDLETLERQVRDFEPHLALSPGATGFEVFTELLRNGRSHLRDGGRMLLEIGFGQSEGLRARANELAWNCDEILEDLAGIPRVAILSPKET